MPSLVTDNFRVFAAEQFMESLEEPYDDNDVAVLDSEASALKYRSKIYLFTGRSQVWSTERYGSGQPESIGVDEFNPPEAFDSFNDMNEIYDDMISVKRVSRADLSQVIRRNTWKSGVKYDMYRNNYTTSNPSINGQTSLYDAQFYVVTKNYQVYKCIFNGVDPDNPNGKQSTVEPTGDNTTNNGFIGPLTDGYIWKYMYTIDIADYIKFVSSDFMPVKTDPQAAANAIDGSIDQLVISNRGTESSNKTYYCPIVGDGTGAIATIVVGSSGAGITSATLNQVGSGYTRGKVLLNRAYEEVSGATDYWAGTAGSPSTIATGEIEVIISPPGGHGSNAALELGGYRVMINKTLDFLDGDGDIPVDSSFRRFGLLSDPQNQSGTDLITTTATACFSMKFPTSGTGAPTGDFVPGSIITQENTNAIGRVIHWDSATGVLRYYQNEYIDDLERSPTDVNRYKLIPFSGSNQVSQSSPAAVTATPSGTGTTFGIEFTNGYAIPEVKKNSGNIIYVENRKAVNRSNDQTEDIKLVVEF